MAAASLGLVAASAAWRGPVAFRMCVDVVRGGPPRPCGHAHARAAGIPPLSDAGERSGTLRDTVPPTPSRALAGAVHSFPWPPDARRRA
eukprot:7390935-Prymnesium_polylepis.1